MLASKRGFTLIELSIVLVIIGLITGGVLAGRELIKVAQIRKTYSEYQQFDAAANTYRLKYNALAGDHANAYDFFGADCGTNTTTISTGCNGNGDTYIGRTSSSGNDSSFGEEPKFFEHLSRANLIAGNFNGNCNSQDSCEWQKNINVPAAAYDGAVWGINAGGCEECSTLLGGSNKFVLSAETQTDGSPSYAFVSYRFRVLSVIDMQSIDSKYDDGMPHTGKIYSYDDSASCTSNNSSLSATYNLTNTAAKCAGYFRMSGF